MSAFSAKGLTNKGRSLQTKAQAGAELHYTKFVLGDGQLSGQSIAALTNVISPKKTVDVSRLKMTPPNQANIGFVLSNQDVTTGFYFREIGLFALDPDEGEILYWYGNAGDTADYIPPTGTSDVINKNFDVLVYVGQAQNVTAVINENLNFVTHEELADAIGGIQINDASTTQKGVTQLSNAVDSISETMAPTLNALKTVNDKAIAAQTAANAANEAAAQAFQLGNERKQEVVDALIALGVSASMADSWDTLLAKMSTIIKATGNATAADVLAGKTFSNAAGNNIVGSMPNQGSKSATLTQQGQQYTIPAGKHDGTGKITASFANLVAGNVRDKVEIGGVVGSLKPSAFGYADLNFTELYNAPANTQNQAYKLIATFPVGVSLISFSSAGVRTYGSGASAAQISDSYLGGQNSNVFAFINIIDNNGKAFTVFTSSSNGTYPFSCHIDFVNKKYSIIQSFYTFLSQSTGYITALSGTTYSLYLGFSNSSSSAANFSAQLNGSLVYA